MYDTAGFLGSAAVPTTCFILGLCFDSNLKALLYMIGKSKLDFSYLFKMVLLFNIISITYTTLFIYWYFLQEDSCFRMSLVTNLTSHLFFIAFDSFLLFKTFVISRNHNTTMWLAVLALAHRVGWGFADLLKSKGVWDYEVSRCEYIADPVTSLGYTIADLVIDWISTITAVVMFYYSEERAKGHHGVWHHLVKENGLDFRREYRQLTDT
ncbi:hypothetical protein BDR26DRAFT_858339 [Obelidium mucronatum]|nr:hypothetical protein BDR26DRAFT_858339 [Obelidium mucronatum]